jgi:hypothetical protein
LNIPIGVLALVSLLLPTAPSAAPAPISFTLAGTAGSNGWHTSNVTIRWTVEPTDLVDTSGCPAAELITAEGTSTRQCRATFTWGTVTSPVVSIKIDKTPPTAPVATPARGPDSNGWYNRSVGVGFSATDDVSGMGSCTGGSYSGPDSASASVTGICTDLAGNTRAGSFSLQYDSTAPGVAAAASRAPDANGWYNRSVSVSFSQSPGDVSGVGSCSPAATYSGPDSATAAVSGTCTDRAGNTSAPLALGLKYDSTPPQAIAAADRAADANGWFNRSLTISFQQASGDLSGPDTCTAPIGYSGPDDAAASRSGTCTDRAGNRSATASLTFKYDSTAPGAVATASRAADVNGWYNRPLTVSFAHAGTDLSGPDTCSAAATYSGPDSASASRSGTCTDRAGNRSAPASVSFKYDSTAPQAVASADRSADANGWFNRALTISFAQAAGDVSGPDTCSAPVSYAGPDTGAASRSGTCTDQAGNQSAAAAFVFKYDATPPVAVASPDRAADSNGWFNRSLTISFAQAAGDLSGPDTCTAAVTYSGPDAASVSRSGTCTDRAGNRSAPAGFAFKYDGTAPSATGELARPPDANGWHNHPVALEVTGSDGLSGIAACGGPPFAGPDGEGQEVSGGCTDVAGNASATVTRTIDYDATGPVATAALERGPDVDGWYNHPVAATVTGTDATSGIAGCAGATYSGPDGAAQTAPGSCTDLAGNTSAPVGVALNYDATPPAVVAALARAPDSNGWFNHPVAVSGAGTDGASGVAGCTSASYGGPDTAGVSLAATCRDRAGNASGPAHVSLKYDASPPAVVATPDRPPVGGGWYRRLLTISFAGTDATSGGVSCTNPARYSGPDDSSARVVGSCRDAAGNSAEAAHAFKYDGTAPRVGAIRARSEKQRIVLRWTRSADAARVELARTPGLNGARRSIVYEGAARQFVDKAVRVGVAYRYELSAFDVAGNSIRSAVTGRARATLYRPAAGGVARAPVVLAWEAQKGVSFYNVQLLRDGVKVLSAWPRAASLRIRATWRHGGTLQRLEPGLYRWYVWAARGTRERPTYGRALGSSTFVVKR